jgi:hypothetical protein
MPALTLARLLADPSAIKVLATTDEDGTPHLTFDDTLHVDADGRLVYLEFEEFSRTNRNLVRALWFTKRVAVQVWEPDGRRFQVRGLPYKCLIAGPRYEEYYRAGLGRRPDSGLASVWLIDIAELTEETPGVRAARDGEGRIPLIHLDRLRRPDAV